MILTVNPGRRLVAIGAFELGGTIEGATPVRDVETGELVTLGRLLRSFNYDPADRGTGPIQITIEPV